jgi:hypothetical protein
MGQIIKLNQNVYITKVNLFIKLNIDRSFCLYISFYAEFIHYFLD